MTNWPNIQEYRNFEAKFFNNSKNIDFVGCAAESEREYESLYKDLYKNNESEDNLNDQKVNGSESKTVRCVIKKDFEESFKKLDRGDGLALSSDSVKPKAHETSVINQAASDKVRLQNHLKWKKQKEEEYLHKKEAEKLAQQKKVEEELRKEKIKKQKEKEREEKIKEWQEQKAREKEEKKKEKMAMKLLEEEIKEATPTVDKEKLIEEWVKLKNKQKQIEAEKKAEILKKEQEGRALRQSLAALSYRQWKERLKGRSMTLPKNGYQIFGPKPVPVVKEDWNHDFINNSPREDIISLRGTKSNTTTSFTIRHGAKHVENFPKDIFYLGNLNSKSPSFYHLKASKSGPYLWSGNQSAKSQYKMPLKELQPGTIELKKNSCKVLQNGLKFDINDHLYSNNYLLDRMYLNPADGDQNHHQCMHIRKPSKMLSTELLPSKKKIDLYINTGSENVDEESGLKSLKKQPPKTINKVQREIKKDSMEKNTIMESKRGNGSKEKLLAQRSALNIRRESFQNKSLNIEKSKSTAVDIAKNKICRRSKSYDKPSKKLTKEKEKPTKCSSSRSTMKIQEKHKPLILTKSKNVSCQKRMSKKQLKPNTPEVTEVDRKEGEKKVKKKVKKKSACLSKSLSFGDSPYCVKKTSSKSMEKGHRRKSAKDGETRSDKVGRKCRKYSMTKI